MQEKVIKIPFNSDFFIGSQKAIWLFSYKKSFPTYLFYTVVAAILLTFGLSIEKGGAFPVLTVVGGGLLFYSIIIWVGVIERRAKFFKRAKNCASRYEQIGLDATYTLANDELIYTDPEKIFNLKWSIFKSAIVFKDNIFITSRDTGGIMFALNRREFGDPAFMELYGFLKEKIK